MAIGSGDVGTVPAQKLGCAVCPPRAAPSAACGGTLRTTGAVCHCRFRLCGRAEKLFLGSGHLRKKRSGFADHLYKGLWEVWGNSRGRGTSGQASTLISMGIYTDMASDAQINANRRNALLSTGPISPRGKARSAMNARKSAIRSEQLKLGRDESIAYESRLFRWAGTLSPKTDSEEFLLHANLFVAGEMDRAERAYFEQAQSAIDQAVDVEIDEAYDTGNLLFSDPRGVPLSLYGTSRFNNRKPGGPSWGSESAPRSSPGSSWGNWNRAKSVACGCSECWKNCLRTPRSISGPREIGCG